MLALALGLGLVAPAAPAQDARVAVPPSVAVPVRADGAAGQDVRALFDAVVATIDKRFFDTERLAAIGWRARADAAWAEIALAHSPAEAVPRLNALLAELKTSHTQIFTPDDVEYYILADVFGAADVAKEFWGSPAVVAGVGMFTAKFEGRDHVTAILEGSPAVMSGLKVGDEIVSVDGAAYAPVASFRGKAGQAAAITIRRRADGPTSVVAVPVVLMQPTQAFERATAASARVIEREGRRIGYVHHWQMRDGQALAKALGGIDGSRRMARTDDGRRSVSDRSDPDSKSREILPPLDALIVDNRVKVGGSASVGSELLATLTGVRGGGFRSFGRDERRNAPPQARSFRGRSAMLVNGGTRSAAEMFAHGYRLEQLGPLIGTRTAGAVSAAQVQRLPGNLLMYVAVAGITIDGERLEGVGVAPDIEVNRPIPYADGADPVLEKALEVLIRQLAPAPTK